MRYYASKGIRDENNWKQAFLKAKEEFLSNQNTINELDEYDKMWESLWDDYNSTFTDSHSQLDIKYEYFENNPFMKIADVNINLSRTEYNESRLAQSILICEALLKTDENQPELWFHLGEFLAQNEMEEKATVALKKCLGLNPKHSGASISLAVCLTNNGLYLETNRILNIWLQNQYSSSLSADYLTTQMVIDEYIKILRIDSSAANDAFFQIALGLLLYNSRDFEKALDCFQYALSLNPKSHISWNMVGATLANSGNNEEAIKKYKAAIDLQPNFIRALHNLAIGCLNIGCFEDAIKYCVKCLKIQTEIPSFNGELTVECIWNTLKRSLVLSDKEHLLEICDKKDAQFFVSSYTYAAENRKNDSERQTQINETAEG